MAEIKLEGLVYDLPDEEYHKVLSPEEASFSSSQFKDALKDIEYFYGKYITKEIVEKISSNTQNNFDIGHAYHGLTLEPQLFDKQFAIYPGPVKRGAAYEKFVKDNATKKILSDKQKITAQFIADAANKNLVSKKLRSIGEAEVSCFVELHGMKVKVRADWIRFEDTYCAETGELIEESFILDMKSTTGNPKDQKKIKKTISDRDYDLSAALYLDAFNKYLSDNNLPLIKQWKFCFDSKDLGTSKVWTATEDMLRVGRAKYMEGLRLIKKYRSLGWDFQDEDSMIDVEAWTKSEWIPTETDGDLL